MNANLESALNLVRDGFAVFPCKPDKSPYTPHGLYDATRNEAVVCAWFKQWADALPALPCGANSLFVVDCDMKDSIDGIANFHAGCAASGVDLSGCFVVETPSGGRHYYFQADAEHDTGNSVCKLGQGIDTRGAKGYVIAPGAVLPDGRAYRPAQGSLRGIATLPRAIAEFLAKPAQPQQLVTVDPSLVTAGDRAWAQRALQSECEKLCKVTSSRNDAANRAAFTLAGYVANYSLDEAEVRSMLLAAMTTNRYTTDKPDGINRATNTINSGLAKGKERPHPLKSQEGNTEHEAYLRTNIVPANLKTYGQQGSSLTPEFIAHLEQKGRDAATQIQTAIPATPVPTAAIADIDAIPSVFAYRSAPIEFAVHNLIAYSAITLISGDAGCGKTTLITAMASHIANGTPFLGYTATQLRRVLYLDRENSLPIVQERLRRLRVADGANLKYFGAHVGEVPMPGSPIVKAWVQRTEPKPVVFIDSLSAFMDGNENSTEDIRRFMQQLRDLATLGAAVVILHHVGKGENAQEYRGSSDIKAAIDVGFILRNFGETRLNKLALKPFKARFTVTDTMAISYEQGQFILENAPQAGDDGLTELLRSNPELKKSEFEALALKRGFKRSHIRSFVDNGLQAGLIRSLTGLKNAQRITLTESMPTGLLV